MPRAATGRIGPATRLAQAHVAAKAGHVYGVCSVREIGVTTCESLLGRQGAHLRRAQLRGTFYPADAAVGMSLFADFETECKRDEMRPGRFVRIVGAPAHTRRRWHLLRSSALGGNRARG
jgi:hypothetical protein